MNGKTAKFIRKTARAAGIASTRFLAREWQKLSHEQKGKRKADFKAWAYQVRDIAEKAQERNAEEEHRQRLKLVERLRRDLSLNRTRTGGA